MMAVGSAALAIFTALVVAAHTPIASPLPSTVPAFLWSPHHHQFSNNKLKPAVNYQTISTKDLAKSVLAEGGWSSLLCLDEKLQPPVDLAVVFVGSELHSSDLSGNKHSDPALLKLLKGSFTRSKFSMAFPYVTASKEEALENSLVSGFTESCGHDLGINNVAFLESCSIEGENFQKLIDLNSIQDHLQSRMENGPKGHTDLVVLCHEGSRSLKELNQHRRESEIISELVSSLDQSGAKYAFLYVSSPSRTIQYPSYRELERFLAEGTVGNVSANSTGCDEVCKIKSSLLEGVLVGVVLLLILISGLCCMMGIDTPTRFEAPQDS